MRLAAQADLTFLDTDDAQWRPSETQIRYLIRKAQAGDEAAGHRLVLAFTHMVAKITREPAFRYLPDRAGAPDHVDLIQEGCAALVTAVAAFDLSKPGHFSGYAATSIRRRIMLLTLTSQTSLHLPRASNGSVPHVETPLSLDRTNNDDDERSAVVLSDPRATAALAQVGDALTDPERAGLHLVFAQENALDDLAPSAESRREISRKVQSAARRVARDQAGLHLAPAPRGCLSATSYALAAAMPDLQMKQQTALHLFHTNRNPAETIADLLGLTTALAIKRIEVAETNLVAAAKLPSPPSPGQLRRAVAAHSLLRERALVHLDPLDAQIIERRLLRGQSSAEVSEALAIRPSVARDRATAARKHLARHEERLLAMYCP